MTSAFLDLNSDKNQNETIDRLVELRSSRAKLLEEDIDRNRDKIFALEDLRKKIDVLDKVSKSLYNPFQIDREFTLKSSDESIISGTASAKAAEGSYSLKVLSLADKQILQSRKISEKIKIPSGKIKFKVAGEEIVIHYLGGDINDFARSLTKNSQGKFEASFVRISDKENYFIIKAKEGGEKNKVIVLEDKKRLLEQAGIFKKQPPIYRSLVSYNQISEDYNLSMTNNAIVIEDSNRIDIPVEKEIDFEKVERLFFRFNTKEDPNLEKDAPIAYVEFTKNGEKQTKPIPYKKNRKGYVNLDSYFFLSAIKKQVFINKFTLVNNDDLGNSFYYGRIFQVIKRPEDQRFLAEKEASKPSKSKVEYLGLTIERDSNKIDDFIQGLTLNLNKVSEKAVDIEVETKKDDLRQRIIDFINSYNLVVETINIYISPDVEKLGVAEDQLPEDVRDKVGVLGNETAVKRLKERLSNQFKKVYVISSKKKIISTQLGLKNNFNLANPYDIDGSKIDFEEDKFLEFSASQNQDLNLFLGYDTNNDRIIDAGLGFEINQTLENYLKPNTFFALAEQSLKSRNERLNTTLERENSRLTEYREELEYSFSRLENAKSQQEGLQKWFDSLGN